MAEVAGGGENANGATQSDVDIMNVTALPETSSFVTSEVTYLGQESFTGTSLTATTTERKRYLKERVEKKEEQVLKIEANVFQVANYYFVFQGVILTAISKGSSATLKCRHVWVPMSLTLIGAIVNLGALLIIADKYRDSLEELDTRTRALYRNLYPDEITTAMNDHKRKKARRNRILVLSTVLFSIFAIINLVAAPVILCL